MNDFESIESASDSFLLGSKDCPGEYKTSQSPYGLCVENMQSRSMWKLNSDEFFTKDYQVEGVPEDF